MRPVRRASCPSALSSTVFSCTSSAATTRCRRASSTAPPIPHAVPTSTTAGGGTRSGASASTTTCASGRKTSSHSVSCRSLGFRERASLDKDPLADRLRRANQLARRIDFAPGVPEQEPARTALLVDVRNRALSIRLLPRLDRLEPGVDLADGLVAEVEQIRVEEREVVVHEACAGHVRAHDLAVCIRVILVL